MIAEALRRELARRIAAKAEQVRLAAVRAAVRAEIQRLTTPPK
jgi:hypothetical protein